MSKNRKKSWMKNTIALLLVAVISVVTLGGAIKAWDVENDGSYLSYVTIASNNQTYKLRGGLRPYAVPADVSWQEFMLGFEVNDLLIVSENPIEKYDKYTDIDTYIYSNGWNVLGTFQECNKQMDFWKDENSSIWNEVADKEYIDVCFSYWDGGNYKKSLYARFGREYNITYNLAEGKFEDEKIDTYITGMDYSIPNPIREGYEFAGWTSEEIDNPVKDLVIKNGSKGDKTLVANWVISAKSKSKVMLSSGQKITDDKNKTDTETQKQEIVLENTSIKGASKELSAKKVKISLNKVAGATGYKIQISKSKKFKNVLVDKTVKKDSFTIKSGKLKNKKKIYVRAKAYKKEGTVKVWSEKWSDAKRVKVK